MTSMRFERTTFRLGGGCSIQLSYGARINSPKFESHHHSQVAIRTHYSELQDLKIVIHPMFRQSRETVYKSVYSAYRLRIVAKICFCANLRRQGAQLIVGSVYAS